MGWARNNEAKARGTIKVFASAMFPRTGARTRRTAINWPLRGFRKSIGGLEPG